MSALRIVVSVVLLLMQVFQVRTLVEDRLGMARSTSSSQGVELSRPVSRVPILITDPDLVRLMSDGWHVSPVGGAAFAPRVDTGEAGENVPETSDSEPRAVAMIHGPDPSGVEDTVLIYGCPCMLGVSADVVDSDSASKGVPGELPVLLLPNGYILKVATELPTFRMDAPDLSGLNFRR